MKLIQKATKQNQKLVPKIKPKHAQDDGKYVRDSLKWPPGIWKDDSTDCPTANLMTAKRFSDYADNTSSAVPKTFFGGLEEFSIPEDFFSGVKDSMEVHGCP